MTESYTGTEILDVMEGATEYRRFLATLIEEVGGTADDRRLLDFGAGIGTYAEEARSLGYSVLCVELDDAQREQLAQSGFETARTLSTVPDATFGALYTLNVLEHVEDDRSAVAELFRVTRPGGRLLVYVPAFPLLFTDLDRQVGHHRRYRRRELVQLASAAGYVVDRCVYADSLGFVSSLAWRATGMRSQTVFTPRAVQRYDRWIFPVSRKLDTVCERFLGKNLVLLARRPG